MNGIVMLAHGSRDPQWVAPFESAVALAYLEHWTPDFVGAVEELVARGATLIKVIPLFLGPGGHVRGDVPQLIERAAIKYPVWNLI